MAKTINPNYSYTISYLTGRVYNFNLLFFAPSCNF